MNVRCPKCEALNEAGAEWCSLCGKRLKGNEQEEAAAERNRGKTNRSPRTKVSWQQAALIIITPAAILIVTGIWSAMAERERNREAERAFIQAEREADKAAQDAASGAAAWLAEESQAAKAEQARRDAEWRRAIEEVADARTKVGGLTNRQSGAALAEAKTIVARFNQLDPDVVIYAVGMFSGLGLSRDALIDAAILIQTRRAPSERFGPFDIGPPETLSRRMGEDFLRRWLERQRKKSESFLVGWRRRETIQGDGLGDPDEKDEGERMKDE